MASDVKHEASSVGATALLDGLGSFKFWRIQKPNAAKLLKEIIFRWRGASAYVRGKPGRWVVWPRERWCEWTGLSRNQLDRALKELVDSNLIVRERHRFAGSEVRTFVRPTAVALKHLGRPQDMALTVLASENVSEKSIEKITKKTSEKASEKISEKTDYTSIPSIPTNPNKSTSATTTEGKGNAGEDEDDEIDKKFAEFKAKKQKAADELYPEKLGPHQKSVKHPSKKFPNWLSFSTELKNTLYQKYVVYIDNWNKGKKGKKHYADFADWTDEDDMALLAASEKKKAKAVAGG